MSSNQNETIIRFRSHEQIETNATTVYATYTSGAYKAFYSTEEEAIAHCSNPDNGEEFNGEWIQDAYSVLAPGELLSFVGNGSVYYASDRSRYFEVVMARHSISFVEWKAKDPLVASSAV
jgi:hypothetical protein